MKKKGIGNWLCLVACALAVAGLVLYTMAVNAGTGLQVASGSDLFYDMARPEDAEMAAKVLPFGIAAIALFAASFIFSQFTSGKFGELLAGLCRIAAPAVVLITILYFAYGSFTGMGWTFFSNKELEIYPQATAVGQQVITAVVVYVLSMLVGIISAFCKLPKQAD
ncbi:MAG: hypothetical protein IJ773_02070 [Lachnospiraceae bacterium]|nr:hypothetical protein [Lachnospiraceae bacterium]